MSDTYVECLVKAKQSGVAKFFKVLLIIFTVIFTLGYFLLLDILVALLAIICGVGAYFLNLYTDLEYEYLYLEKELVIDKIMGKSKRKRIGTYSVDRIEIMAPVRSYQLDNYKNRKVTEKDYSIGEVLKPDLRYAMYYEGGERIILSPSADLVKVIKNAAPRKVFME